MNVVITEEYRPSEDEPYMSERQVAYFKRKLVEWREELLEKSKKTLSNLREEKDNEPEFVDKGMKEYDLAFELRTRDRYRKLIKKIDDALDRIDVGDYGYCEETGEEIGLKRLEARPIATLTIEAQERHERKEKSMEGR